MTAPGPTLVTGGAGYLGVPVVEELLAAGRPVRVLDRLLHGQAAQAEALQRAGAEVVVGDVRDPGARAEALAGAAAVVHLAAIVGDPACRREPEHAHAVNVVAARALADEASAAGADRFVFASTCSNYGRMADPSVPVDEEGELAPVSLYAEQKVALERDLLGRTGDGPAFTCLRFATLFGVAPRMRFDLTVNEFTRDLWAGRRLEVFGEQFWRPYVHVRDAARAVRLVLDAPRERVAGEVLNVGDTAENHRKQDLVRLVRERVPGGEVVRVPVEEDPRDYRVSFAKVARVLGFGVTRRVPDGIAELVGALDAGAYPDAFDGRYRNVA